MPTNLLLCVISSVDTVHFLARKATITLWQSVMSFFERLSQTVWRSLVVVFILHEIYSIIYSIRHYISLLRSVQYIRGGGEEGGGGMGFRFRIGRTLDSCARTHAV